MASSNKRVEPSGGKTMPECFVIMPIADPEGYKKGHFRSVYRDIFGPAIEAAGFAAYRADDDSGTNLIHLEILRKLIEAPMAICDLSSKNPNVLFELGIRQAFDKPVVLVQEVGTQRIFDISGIRCLDYRPELLYHEVLEDQIRITDTLRQTFQNDQDSQSVNSIVRLLSISPASLKEAEEVSSDPKYRLLLDEITSLRRDVSVALFAPQRPLREIRPKSDLEGEASERYMGLRAIAGNIMSSGDVPIQLYEITEEILRWQRRLRQAEHVNPALFTMFSRLEKQISAYLTSNDDQVDNDNDPPKKLASNIGG